MAKSIQGKFVHGQKFVMGAETSRDLTKPHKKGVSVILPSTVVTEYEAFSKPWPDDLPSTYEGVPIIWINNIGLQKKDRSIVPDELDTDYELQFVIPTEFAIEPEPVIKVLYFMDNRLQEMTKGVDYEVSSGQVNLKLRHTDPPIGIGGR